MTTKERGWISMARTRSISSIETEIAKLEAELNKAQEKVEAISAKLLTLQKQKQEYEAGKSWKPTKRATRACRN